MKWTGITIRHAMNDGILCIIFIDNIACCIDVIFPLLIFQLATDPGVGQLNKYGRCRMDMKLGCIAGFKFYIQQPEILILHYHLMIGLLAHLHLGRKAEGQKGGKGKEEEEAEKAEGAEKAERAEEGYCGY